MKNTFRIEIDVSMYESVEAMQDARVIEDVVNQVKCILQKEGYRASCGLMMKASKNAVSLLLSRKKKIPPTILIIYIPMNTLESILDNLVPNSSSDDDLSDTNLAVDDDRTDLACVPQLSPSVPSAPTVSFLMNKDMLDAKLILNIYLSISDILYLKMADQ